MNPLRELKSADVRRINGLTRRMAAATSWASLSEISVRYIPKVVPIDYVAWNTFNRERTCVCHVAATPGLQDRANELLDEVNAYLFSWHPILSTVGWAGVENGLTTMSDLQSVGQFRQTPLFRQAYRYLEADYQAAESIGFYGDLNLTMSYNRRLRDFSRRERAMLQLINRRIDQVAREIHRRHVLRQKLDRLTALAEGYRLPTDDLTVSEIHGIASLVRGEPTSPDIKARLREKLGMDNTKQLTSLVCDLFARPRQSGS